MNFPEKWFMRRHLPGKSPPHSTNGGGWLLACRLADSCGSPHPQFSMNGNCFLVGRFSGSSFSCKLFSFQETEHSAFTRQQRSPPVGGGGTREGGDSLAKCFGRDFSLSLFWLGFSPPPPPSLAHLPSQSVSPGIGVRL